MSAEIGTPATRYSGKFLDGFFRNDVLPESTDFALDIKAEEEPFPITEPLFIDVEILECDPGEKLQQATSE